tara:strand:+ start:6094 stop:7281 length:1188 start_codon:yes stop_codon:yes gene_type:complete
MSSLLKEAIIDAKALRDAALKTAETTIVEKYSNEVRDTLERLLEQDEDLDLGGDLGQPEGELAEPDLGLTDTEGEEIAEDVPLASTDDLGAAAGTGLRGLPSEGEPQEITVSLDALQEAVAALEAELSESEELELNEEDLFEMLSEDETEAAEEDEEDEEELDEAKGEKGDADPLGGKRKDFDADLDGAPDGGDKDKDDPDIQEVLNLDSIAKAIAEELEVDMGAELTGWAGNSADYMKHEMEREMAHRRSTDTQEELKDLKKAQEELVFENSQLKEQLSQYKQATNELKESLQDVNLSNARLLYTNRVLRNTSLNERQKETIVEAISKAGSVAEARTILDTLQSTVRSTPKRGPKSLSEAINRRSTPSVIRASRKESTDSDPFSDRMKRLAGIK